jgi:SAM-dependent methyltransferase
VLCCNLRPALVGRARAPYPRLLTFRAACLVGQFDAIQSLTGERMGWMRKVVPAPILEPARALVRWWGGQPPVGRIDFGALARLQPISRSFGTDRGLAIDRYYIERFLDAHRADVRGRVLEIGEDTYTRRFGDDRVSESDVLHVHDRNRRATFVGDLANIPEIPDNRFDCIILTQTLQLVFDVHAAMRTLGRILAPGGVLLVTVPGISQVAAESEWGRTWYWAFTPRSVERLLREVMQADELEMEVHGNVMSSTAFLYGLASEEVSEEALRTVDPDYPLIINARATKGSAAA